jgi:hypothetical protein
MRSSEHATRLAQWSLPLPLPRRRFSKLPLGLRTDQSEGSAECLHVTLGAVNQLLVALLCQFPSQPHAYPAVSRLSLGLRLRQIVHYLS